MPTRRRLSFLCALGVALSLLTGCPGRLDDKERFLRYAATHTDAGRPVVVGDASPCGDVVTDILIPHCGDGGCHDAQSPQQGLDLVSPGVASRVVGVAAKECTGTLVNPQDPAKSLLYRKLSTKPACGAQMPLARTPLTGEETACVLGWIAGL